MLRRVLSAYLAFLMAAAPCLCCCTAGRLMATPPTQPAEPQPSCCCHEGSPQSDPAPIPLPPPPDSPDRCPCREHQEKQALVGPAGDLNSLRLTFRLPHFDAADFLPAMPEPALTADINRLLHRREPFPSSTDLLFVHHRLRC
jgi:hypothetical protein